MPPLDPNAARAFRRSRSKPAPKPAKAPVTDVQSSGPKYGLRKAAQFKRTTTYKQIEGAAKPVRQTDVTSSGTGYGKPQAARFVAGAHASMHRALTGKPFDPKLIQGAKDLGLPGSKDFKVTVAPSGKPYVIHRHRRAILPDYNVTIDPRQGGEASPFTKDAAAIEQQQKAGAPVMKILAQTARPVHAIAGFATEGPKGFEKGLVKNTPYTFGKIFKKAGLPAGVAGGLGFVADVAADPTTYVTFGAGSVAEKAAQQAATKVATRYEEQALVAASRAGADALKAGKNEAAAKAASKTAHDAVMREGAQQAKRAGEHVLSTHQSQTRGATIQFGSKQVPGVTRATAKAGEGVKTVARAVPGAKTAATGVKKVASDVRPQLTPVGANPVEHVAVRQAGRQARSEYRAGAAEATRRFHAARRLIPKDQYEGVISAIERGKIRTLPEELQQHAIDLKDALAAAKRVRRQAGISEGELRNYFPHALADELQAGQGIHETVPAAASKGVRKVTLGSSKKRADLRPLDVQNPERVAKGETPFSTNLPLVFGEYMRGTARAVAAKHLARNLAEAGRPVRPGETHALHPDDQIFHYHNGDLTPVKDVPATPAAGRYVILNKTVVEREMKNIAPQADRTATGAVFDRGTGAFKRIATFTPGFHFRNLVGDTQMAYLAQPGHKLPGSVGQAAKAVRRLSQIEHAQEHTLAPIERTTGTIKVAGEHRNLDDFVNDAQKHGVIRSGYIGRELREQAGSRGISSGSGGRVQRWMQNREDLMRLATYKHGLDRGLTPSQAADLSTSAHIDYGDLTKFERSVARRAVPFYTFSARGLPIHGKALVTHPGKYATIEKAREEAAAATGLNLGDEEKKLKQFQARQAPFILKLGGKKYVLSDSLPLNLLNEIPVSKNPGAYISELSQWVGQLASPIIKDPVEFYANRSFFFRSDIQSKTRPLVAAPNWVAAIYNHDRGFAAKLGITPNYVDKKSGKRVWGWDGKADYVAKSVPGLPNILQQIASGGANRRGQGLGQKVLAGVTGVRSEPLDPEGAMMEVLYAQLDKVGSRIGALNQQGIKAGNATVEYRQLTGQQKQLQATISRLSARRGDKVPLFSRTGGGAPVKSLGSSLGSGGVGGGGLGGGL